MQAPCGKVGKMICFDVYNEDCKLVDSGVCEDIGALDDYMLSQYCEFRVWDEPNEFSYSNETSMHDVEWFEISEEDYWREALA